MSIHDKRRKAFLGHRAATRKVSRLKANNGVEVSGSKHDPRASPEFIRNASEKDLNALIRRQDKFLDRSTQFVPDAHMKPLPKQLWNEFKTLEAKKNDFVEKYYEPFKDIHIGPAGQTVDQRMIAITPLHAHMGQRTTDSPYKKADLSSTSVYGETGLKALIQDTRKRTTRTYQQASLKNHRAGVMKMLDSVGDLELQEALGKLTKKQFALLWKYTPFASNIKPVYNHYKDAMRGRKGVTNSQMLQTDLTVAKEYIEWAGNVKGIKGS